MKSEVEETSYRASTCLGRGVHCPSASGFVM